jgi:hypothetical protein
VTTFIHRTTNAPTKLSPLLILLLIFQAAIGGVAFTYTHPTSALDCPLSDQWLKLYRTKNAGRIRAIQDAFDCCGFRTVLDMPWPFPSAHDKTNTCATRFERTQGCLTDWRASEQQIAGLLIVIDVLSIAYLWLVGIERWPQGGWMNWAQGNTNQRQQRAIDYQNETGERYSDEPTSNDRSVANRAPVTLIDEHEEA